MLFYFAGGAMEVGGSCIYLRAGRYGILFGGGFIRMREAEKRNRISHFY